MRTSIVHRFVCLALILGAGAGVAVAQDPAAPLTKTETSPPVSVSASASGFDTLRGRWIRPDGGYAISIKGVDASGKLDAGYANPHPLPFFRADATHEGKAIKVLLELRAGGYDGSTYTLTYDPATDVLRGTYYQAVAQQTFDVYFVRDTSWR